MYSTCKQDGGRARGICSGMYAHHVYLILFLLCLLLLLLLSSTLKVISPSSSSLYPLFYSTFNSPTSFIILFIFSSLVLPPSGSPAHRRHISNQPGSLYPFCLDVCLRCARDPREQRYPLYMWTLRVDASAFGRSCPLTRLQLAFL